MKKSIGPMKKSIGKKIAGVLSGMIIAVAVTVCAFGLVRLSFLSFPAWNLERVQWAELLAVIVIPETIFMVAALTPWRKRRSMAIGILLSGVTRVTHFVVHLTTH